MANTPCRSLAAPELVREFAKRGFRVEDTCIGFVATKSYPTAVGLKEAVFAIYTRDSGYVRPSYLSEGRNILETMSFRVSADPAAAIQACEDEIAQSYAARLYALGVVSR